MQFRKDLNGLRAIAVIAVVLFHFNASWIPGGFAGVDVFFVISGFLMTGIIFRGLEQENFSIISFYISRANRIIPALALLCLVLLLFGWFYIIPPDYTELGKHALSSVTFLSNFVFWTEAGYFDAASQEKWLLHTWSLSVEWQFYLIYPLILVAAKQYFTLKIIKLTVLIGSIVSFILAVIATYKSPDAAYFLLPTRAWEMLVGGVAYLYPFELNQNERNKKLLERLGVILILGTYLLMSEESPWPGYLAIFPVLGAFFIIQAQRNDSIITSNQVFQKLGTWSYSIYLWHWPLVVAIYYFSLNEQFIYVGIALSVLLGFLSYKYIEKIKFKPNFDNIFSYLKCKPIYMVLIVGACGMVVYKEDGFIAFTSTEYQYLIVNANPSPLRSKCHIEEYQKSANACEYFKEKIVWATFGDSHATEIAYALAEKLKLDDIGLKHFSFSGCKPSYKESENFSKCAKWYNETVQYLVENTDIKNVVFNHRFTMQLLGGNGFGYPQHANFEITEEVSRMTENMDELILLLASKKNNIYIFYPVPELPSNINQLIDQSFRHKDSLLEVLGTDLAWYQERNKYIINHFENANYPENVHLLKPQDVYCDKQTCYAVKDGIPLYFDDNHPSLMGAAKLVELIK